MRAPTPSSRRTSLGIDHLRSAQVQRETYIGPWLPEPVVEEPAVARQGEMVESLSMAFMLIMEALTPVERAVFLLHDVLTIRMARSPRL